MVVHPAANYESMRTYIEGLPDDKQSGYSFVFLIPLSQVRDEIQHRDTTAMMMDNMHRKF